MSCERCQHAGKPGLQNTYCGGPRPDLPKAYGTNHPLRKLPADKGKSCPHLVERGA